MGRPRAPRAGGVVLLVLLVLVLDEPMQAVAQTCTYRTFSGQSFPSAVGTSSADGVGSNSGCSAHCEDASDCIGYTWDDGAQACRLVSSMPDDVEYNSGVCVKRGGCDGSGLDTQCVWLPLQDVNMGEVMSTVNSSTSSTSTSYEATCKSSCEIMSDCVAYSWRKQDVGASDYHLCTLYTTLGTTSSSSSTISTVCLRGLHWSTLPSSCWTHRACSTQPILTVPSEAGGPYVTVSLSPMDGVYLSGNRTVATNGTTATYTDLHINSYGRYRLVAEASTVTCPAYSPTFKVDNLDRYTLWRWNSNFPARSGNIFSDGFFLLVRLKNDCTIIAFLLTIVAAAAVSTAISILTSGLLGLSIKKTIRYAILTTVFLVFVHDFRASWVSWSCNPRDLIGLDSLEI